MRVDLHAKVRTSDGEDAGSVEQVVLDPESSEVKYFVVKTGWLLGRSVMVPREEIEKATVDGETLRVGLTKDEMDRLDDFVPEDYRTPPTGWQAPPIYGYPASGYLWPAGYSYPSPPVAPTPEPSGQGKRDLTLEKGAEILDRSGEHIGVIDDVRLDPSNGELEGLVIRVGGVLETLVGAGKTVEVPGNIVDRVEHNLVYLTVDKEHFRGAA